LHIGKNQNDTEWRKWKAKYRWIRNPPTSCNVVNSGNTVHLLNLESTVRIQVFNE